jgi:hypothetical protein
MKLALGHKWDMAMFSLIKKSGIFLSSNFLYTSETLIWKSQRFSVSISTYEFNYKKANEITVRK